MLHFLKFYLHFLTVFYSLTAGLSGGGGAGVTNVEMVNRVDTDLPTENLSAFDMEGLGGRG
jgi:hypothetical protein